MARLAIIGGTGLTSLPGLEIKKKEVVATPYGTPSGPFTLGTLNGKDILFLPRHGYGHTIPPHMVNYRANIWALSTFGVKDVIAVATVGGINPQLLPTRLSFPNQIIDYTYGRHQTFFETDLSKVTHIDFSSPYCESLRQLMTRAAREVGLDAMERGVYAATQGPRLETAAEIDRLNKDGCDMVGMTGMPEAALAREMELCYATCAICANWAAGRGTGEITMEEIHLAVEKGMNSFRSLLRKLVEII